MSYEELSEKEKKKIELGLLERARAYWDEFYPRTEANDLAKMRGYSKEGLVQGVIEHRAKHTWYAKQGYWEDGTTTLEAHKKGLLLRKIEFGKKITSINNSRLLNIKEAKDDLIKLEEELERLPKRLQTEFNAKEKAFFVKIKEKSENEFKILKDIFDKKIREFYTDYIKNVEMEANRAIDENLKKMESLHQGLKRQFENKVSTYGAKLMAELTIQENKGKDDLLVKQYLEEVKKINTEINSLVVKKDVIPLEAEVVEVDVNTDLNEFTIPALKALADQKGLNYEPRIRKADLIELLEG